MNQFTKIAMLLMLSAAVWLSPDAARAQACAPNWSTTEFKSFGNVQDEVRKRYGEVRILRVALCDQGGNPYFQGVIISGQGEVRRVQVGATN